MKQKITKIAIAAYMAYSVTADIILIGGVFWLIFSGQPNQNTKGCVPRETATGSNALAGAPLEFFGAGAPVVK